MLWPGFEGPREQWHAELQALNKFGLLAFIDSLMIHLDAITGGMQRESLLKTIRNCKQHGKWDAEHARHIRLMANPAKYIDEQIRRSRAAKKAARRRKRNAR